MKMKFPPYAHSILNMLHKNGYEAYLVGGCVRDALMEREGGDIDITTNAMPEQVKAVFEEYNVIETGIKHGTVTVVFDGEPIEITTYRTENGYTDNRHPDKVSFTSRLEDDLSRRDFTMNALCFDGEKITDIFGGEQDIETGIVRAIGNAQLRFEEDALRILRALRFSSVLGFTIENETSAAIHKLKHLLLNLSVERVFSELKKLLCGKNVKNVLYEYFDVFEAVLPELKGMKGFNQKNFHHKFDIAMHTATVVESIEPEPALRLAALFHDCGKTDTFSVDESGVGHFYSHPSVSAEKADEALKRLKSDTYTREMVVTLVKAHDIPVEGTERMVLRRLNRFGEDVFRKLLKLKRADIMGLADEYRCTAGIGRIEAILENVLKKESCFSVKQLSVNGNDMIALGITGKGIGITLNELLKLVIDGDVENKKDMLIEEAKKLNKMR